MTPFEQYVQELQLSLPTLSTAEIERYAQNGFVFDRQCLLWDKTLLRWRPVTRGEFHRTFPWSRVPVWYDLRQHDRKLLDVHTQEFIHLNDGSWTTRTNGYLPWWSKNALPFYQHDLPSPLSPLPVSDVGHVINKRYRLSKDARKDFAIPYLQVRTDFTRCATTPERWDIFKNIGLIYRAMDHSFGEFRGTFQGQEVYTFLSQPRKHIDPDKVAQFCRLWGCSYNLSTDWDSYEPGNNYLLELMVPCTAT